MSDDNGTPWDRHIPQLLDIAHKYLLKVSCFIPVLQGNKYYTGALAILIQSVKADKVPPILILNTLSGKHWRVAEF